MGLGGVGQRHLRNLRTLRPECRVAALRHGGRTFEIGNDMAADMGVDIVAKYGVEVVADMNAALAFGPDVAIVANPSAKHVEACLPLLRAGVPVFLEKPAATTPADYAALDTAQKAAGAPLAVGYQLRWHPCVLRLKDILDDGALGQLHSVEISVQTHMPSWHAYEKPTEFYAGVRTLGGGVVLTEIHEIDLLTWFFGQPDTVYAVGGTLGSYNIDVEDTFAATLSCRADGRLLPISLSMSFVQAPPSRRFVVNGSAGVAILEIPKLRLTVLGSDGAGRETLDATGFDRNAMFTDELTHFLDCVAGKRAPLTSLGGIRAGQMTAFAIRRSLESGQPESPER